MPAAALLTGAVLTGGGLELAGVQAVPPWLLTVVPAECAVAWAVGVALPGRVAVGVLAAPVVAGLGFTVLDPGLPAGLLVFLGWTAVLALAGTVGARRRDGLARTARALADAAATRVRAEHDRLARELHDVVAHQLSELAVRAASAPHRLDGVGPVAAAEFAELGGLARGALGEMRRFLGVLRGDPVAEHTPQPDLADLPGLVGSARRAGLRVRLDAAGPAGLPAATGLSAYRIVQEALSNAARHAAGAAVSVRVRVEEDVLRVEVVNGRVDGPVPPAPGAGLGVIGMRERARLLGGRVTAGPTPDGGFAVRAELPLEPAAPQPDLGPVLPASGGRPPEPAGPTDRTGSSR